ncbi:S8 family serine peptidase [Streptomyces sp. NPDC060198]|uniref:S8 family serine peptidase n=1 Tax=Streptomyces sp. NPDC060198 TaxID=3347070 RepID=UPI00364B7AD9
MTAEMSPAPTRRRSRGARRRLVGALAATAAWSACFAGLAPSAVAQDVQAEQWYLDAMQAEEMWKVSTGKGITVAVIDTGVNPDTPSLRGQVLKGWDATEADGDENDDYDGHGTTMAELIAGTGDGGGLKGLAPGARIVPYRIANTEFQNHRHVNAHDSADAIRAAADSDARIISMSFASEFPLDDEREAAKYALSKGKLFFAGVGNNAEEGNKEQYPAAYTEVVGVSAASSDGKVAEFSQNGGVVDLASPGIDIPIWCDSSFKDYCDTEGGTSQATAIASASAALVWSAHPDWTANQVLRVLFDTAARDWPDDETSAYLGHGLIRPSMNLLKHKGDPGDPAISPLTGKSTSASGSGSTASAAPSGSASPSASASASSQPSQGKSGDATVVAGSSESEDSGNNLGLIACGVVVVVVLGGGALYFLRRRRSAV